MLAIADRGEIDEETFSLLDEMPQELWEHDAAMAIRHKLINILLVEAEQLSGQLHQCGADSEAVAAVKVLMTRITQALVCIIDELGTHVTAKTKMSATQKLAGIALCKSLESVDRLFEEEQATTTTCQPGSRETFFTSLSPSAPTSRCCPRW